MEEKKFSVLEAIVYGFKSVLDNFRLFFLLAGTLLCVALVAFGIAAVANLGLVKELYSAMPQFKECTQDTCSILANQLIKPMMYQHSIALAVTGILMLILFLGLFLGCVRVVLDFHDTHTSSIKRLFSCFGRTPIMFVALLIYVLTLMIGLVLLIVPGVYAGLRLRFFPFFIVDKNAGIVESLRKSYAATQGSIWQLFALLAAWITLAAPFNLTPFGMIILFPALELSYAFVYRRLVGVESFKFRQVV